MSHYTRPSDLEEALRIDWVATWGGWQEFAQDVAGIDDDTVKAEVTTEYVQRFGRLVLQSVVLQHKSDSVRRQELEGLGKGVVRGLVHGQSDCCYD